MEYRYDNLKYVLKQIQEQVDKFEVLLTTYRGDFKLRLPVPYTKDSSLFLV